MAERLNESLQAALADLAKWLDEANIPAIIIGRVAASVLAEVRSWVREFATAMSMPDMLRELDTLLEQRQ